MILDVIFFFLKKPNITIENYIARALGVTSNIKEC